METSKQNQKLVKGLLAFYLLFMIWILLFRNVDVKDLLSFGRLREFNPIPFVGDLKDSGYRLHALLNTVIFVPVGNYLRMLKKDSQTAVAEGFLIGCLMELFQYILAAECADVTDLILNTVGCAIGTGLYGLLGFLVPDRKIRNHGLSKFCLVMTLVYVGFTLLRLTGN